MAGSPTPRSPDGFDRAILRIIQQDNKTPQRSIAEAVNLSTAAVQRRIAAMERAGIIQHNVAIIDPAALALTITAIVEVFMADERAATIDHAKAVFRAAPEVQQCYYVTGGTSFVVVIVASDMPAYQALARRLFEQNEAVSHYRTMVALDRVKMGAELTID
ncbi:winged helix-turn-helix transcriptional regulator [Altererythrobacter xixiisoli]|uniref:Winged helix-turn-helix transcriptional regulator n=1 Tax=Croceibacterium xixiisoli TaxID=1476466 RepID=A0A6I4TQV5_9SPHN|nr:Lrp/AsnC family transcriptional regulator [Croceibacterium xixiisoli]MXO98276.1 winged helix-turn-helix transcriptional regulator [Croceibacterium xixiisoli]